MKTELKAKFLHHLNQKQQEEGFTLIELLVVIIIIGILSAIALPNFLNQSAKAKQSEARQNISSVNRVQIAYRTENSTFASTFDALALGTLKGSIYASTSNYSYTISGSTDTATIIATALDTALKAHSGGNSRNTSTSVDTVTLSIICEAKTPGMDSAVPPDVSTSAAPSCGSNYRAISQ